MLNEWKSLRKYVMNNFKGPEIWEAKESTGGATVDMRWS